MLFSIDIPGLWVWKVLHGLKFAQRLSRMSPTLSTKWNGLLRSRWLPQLCSIYWLKRLPKCVPNHLSWRRTDMLRCIPCTNNVSALYVTIFLSVLCFRFPWCLGMQKSRCLCSSRWGMSKQLRNVWSKWMHDIRRTSSQRKKWDCVSWHRLMDCKLS